MKFKVKFKQLCKLSKRRVTRVYDSGSKVLLTRPTLRKIFLKDYAEEESNALLEQLQAEATAVEQDMFAEYPKLPRKAKKAFKKKLNGLNNAYIIGYTLLVVDNGGI